MNNFRHIQKISKMATYKLQYFNGRGLAEVTRYMFALSGQTYEDQRYNITFPTYEKPEYDADQAAGHFAINMNRVPILTYNGVQIGQSKTIERFVAKKLGFAGSTDVEEALIDMITEHVRDIKQKFNDAKAGKTGEELEAAKTAFVTTELPKWLDKLELSLGKNGYAVGDKVSLADITLFSFLREFFDAKETVNAIVDARPTLLSIVSNVEAGLKSYIDARPVTVF